MATALEPAAAGVASRHRAARGWSPGKHGRDD
jgi:hypothetical protein